MRLSRKHSLGRKLLLLMALASGIALLVSSVAFVVNDIVAMRRSKVRQLTALVDVLASNSEAALSFGMAQSATELLASLENRPTVESACLFDADGKTFAVYQRTSESGLPTKSPDWQGHRFLREGYLEIALPVTEEGNPIGVLYARASMRDVHEQLFRYGLIALAVMLLSQGIAVFLSSKLQRLISAPIISLAAAAERITKRGDYSIRVPSRSNDEIGNLYDQFNLMLDRIQAGENALRSERDHSAGIVKGTPAIVCGILKDGATSFVNPAGERITGYSKDEIAGKNWWITMYPGEEYRQVEQLFKELEQHEVRDYEMTLTAKDGSLHVIAWNSLKHSDSDGNLVELIGFGNDITERKRAAAERERLTVELEVKNAKLEQAAELERKTVQLSKAKEAAEAASRAKSEFLSSMSHELRTPLNAILGFSQLMLRDQDATPSQKETLSIIGRSGEHLLALINDVLEMSKIEAGRTTLDESDFDLDELLDGLQSMFLMSAQSKGLRLSVEYSDNVPRYARSDERKLRQVLFNLLSNAIKFTETGSVTVRVDYATDQERLHIEVEDTGSGISPEEMKIVLTPFGQTESGRRSQEGTGLGLAISRRFVELMGGELTGTSQIDKGTVFQFDIPAPPVDATLMMPRSFKRHVIGLAPGQRARRILVVEDKEESRQLLVQLLDEVGLKARGATNGKEAVDIWTAWKPDLIWMDMNMPVMDGHEATRHIREADRKQQTTIIALTASAFEEDRQRILACGCDDFVRKPFRETELFEKMAEHLGLEYVYQEDHPKKLGLTTVQMEQTTDNLAELLAELNADTLVRLNRSAVRGALDDIEALVEEIRQEHPSAAKAITDLEGALNLQPIISATQLACPG